MPRGVTQTRTFAYDTDQRLISATNPENGTVTYAYNSDSTLQSRIDARGQRTSYSYDAYKRVTGVYRHDASGLPQGCQWAYLSYDQNTADPAFTANGWGRMVTAEYWACDPQGTRFLEMYSYTQAGLKTKKRMRFNAPTTGYVDLDGVWSYDGEGRVTSVSYPLNGGVFNYFYDSLGRPNRLSQGGADLVSGVTYGPAGELTAMNWGDAAWSLRETRTYNVRLQLTRQTAQALVGGNWVTDVDLEYRFPATQNNGQITQSKDWMTGEEVTYAYDSLSRLISASTTGPEWGQSYGYDGFGNRTTVTVTKGTAPSGNLTIDPMTNRITNPGFSYDANGNLTAMPLMSISYDVAHRVLSVSGDTSYAYDSENRRVWKASPREVYYYGVDGRRLGAYRMTWGAYPPATGEILYQNMYFAGRLIKAQGKWVATDRLGSVVKSEGERLRYFPWGEEQATTAQNRDKFGTYFRDSTGLDYAMNRYYSSSHGRFLTPDSDYASAPPSKPQSWNRYTYVVNDPINQVDPTGLAYEDLMEFLACAYYGRCGGGSWGDRESMNTRCYGGSCGGGGNMSSLDWGQLFEALAALERTSVFQNWLTPEQFSVAVSASAYYGGLIESGLISQAIVITAPCPVPSQVCVVVNVAASVVLTVALLVQLQNWMTTNAKDSPVGWPGNDPAKTPGEGWEWQGSNPEPGSREGSWTKPSTGESLHPDLGNTKEGPHWDYIDPSGRSWRVWPDGKMTPKKP